MAYIEDVLVDINNNCHLFRHGVNYAYRKFLKVSKMLRKLINMIFSNLNLASLQK